MATELESFSYPNDNVLKVCSLVFTFSVAFGAAIMPLYLAAKAGHWINYGNVFSAGIFLSMGLLHLLPSAGDSFKKHYGEEFELRYRPEFALCIVGYAVVMTVQRVVFPTPTCPSQVHDLTHCHPKHTHMVDASSFGSEFGSMARHRAAKAKAGEPDESTRLSDVGDFSSMTFGRREISEYGATSIIDDNMVPTECCKPDGGHHHGDGCPSSENCEVETHLLLRRSERLPPAAVGRSYVLMLALSIHSLTEGVALGLQTGTRDIVLLLSAILSHKWAESFALGSSFVATGAPRHVALRFLATFASSTPVGILLGWYAHSYLPPSTSAVFKALSAGTFLYIGASEVVVEEFVQGKQYWIKWVWFTAGLFVMYALHVWRF